MTRKIICTLSIVLQVLSTFLLVQNSSFAQQPAQYTIYMYNPYGIHPAAAGTENTLVATGVYRQQWSGLKGAPVSQQINAHLPFNMINSGFGINLENDKAGLEQTLAASLTYAYKLILNKNSILSMGINTGFVQKRLNGEDIRTPNGDYTGTSILHNDVILSENTTTAQAPLLDASLFFQRKNIKIGFTAKNLINNRLKNTINNTKVRLIKNYLFTFATDFEITDNFSIKPSLLLRSDLKESQTEISFLTEWSKKFSVGMSFRGYNQKSLDAIALVGGMKLSEKLNLIYAYDISLSPLKTVNTGSHEILLQYNLGKNIGKGRPEKIIYNTRYY